MMIVLLKSHAGTGLPGWWVISQRLPESMVASSLQL